MTPSKPAVMVPIEVTPNEKVDSLFYAGPGPALQSRGAALDRRKADAHIVPLDPEFFLLIGAQLNGEQDAAAAGAAARDANVGQIVVPAARSPVVDELVEAVTPAR